MRSLKSLVVGCTAICLLSALLVCGSGSPAAAAKAAFPSKPITMIVPFAAGGSTDVGARLLAAEAEKLLGQPIVIVNKPGAGGWLGWRDLLQAEKDGYTIAHLNDLAIILGILDPQQKRKNTLDDFAPIVAHVIDYSTISAHPKETRFGTIKELIEYAKTHEVTGTSTGPVSDEYLLMLSLNEAFKTKFIPVHNKGAAESLTAVMGRHVDVMFGNVGDTAVPASNGQVKALAVAAEKRSKFMADVPTVKEVTGVFVEGYSSRGIGTRAGVDPAILKILIDAFEKAANSQAFKANMAKQGFESSCVTGADYMKMMKKEEADMKKYGPLLGWK
ncbi:MAG: tripartite tricarboxylate transporter substrate binding protein [Candidatus Methylomirabilota bacterium]